MSIVNNSNYGFFPAHELNKDTIVYNIGGGAQWTGASVDPYKNIIYVSANQIPYKLRVLQTYDINKNFQYKIKMSEPLRDLDGYPGVKPPWGTLTAINLNTGIIYY